MTTAYASAVVSKQNTKSPTSRSGVHEPASTQALAGPDLASAACVREIREHRETRSMSRIDPFERVRRLRRAADARGTGESAGRVPPGQSLTHKFPVLTYGPTPRVSTEDWRLRVFGLVEAEREWDWPGFLALPMETQTVDIHCVTRWSKLDTTWTGVPFTELLKQAPPRPEADHVLIHCHGGYTTNMRLDEMREPGVMVAHRYEGQPLEREHGGPARLLVRIQSRRGNEAAPSRRGARVNTVPRCSTCRCRTKTAVTCTAIGAAMRLTIKLWVSANAISAQDGA